MRADHKRTCLLFTLALAIFLSSCAPSLRKIGRRDGCDAAEEYLQAYIVRDIKQVRFQRNLPYRVALLPLSLTVGFLLNYFVQVFNIVPAVASHSSSLNGPLVQALFIEKAATYSPFKGKKLDKLDDSIIAGADFDVGRCYYESGDYSQASTYFEELLHSNYRQYIGEENLLFLLGDCYYMLSIYDRAVFDYRKFLEYCHQNDERIPLVKERIKMIEALSKR